MKYSLYMQTWDGNDLSRSIDRVRHSHPTFYYGVMNQPYFFLTITILYVCNQTEQNGARMFEVGDAIAM